MEPLTPEDVVAAPRVVTLPETIHDIFRGVREGIPGVTRVKSSGLQGGRFQTFAPSEPKWFRDHARFGNAYPELLYWHEEDWTPDQRGTPAFWAGITFSEFSDETRYALLDEDWQASLPGGVSVGGSGRLLRLGRTKYLSELVVAGVTFDEQVEALRVWASQAITDVMDSDHVAAPARRLDGPDEAPVIA